MAAGDCEQAAPGTIAPRQIVDAHQHFWYPDMHTHAWLDEPPLDDAFQGDMRPIWGAYGPADFHQDINGSHVVKSVYIECGWTPPDTLGEVRWAQSLADDGGFPHAIIGYARLEDPNLRSVLETCVQFPNFRGIRQALTEDPAQDHPDPAPSAMAADSNWRNGLRTLAEMGLTLDLVISPWQMREAATLAQANPDLTLVVNHAGMPAQRDRDYLQLWRDGLRSLGRFANVGIKLSGLGMFDHQWSVESIRPLVTEAVDLFGPDRAMFASNWPVDRLYSSYGDLVRAMIEIMSPYTTDERDRFFATTAIEFYRL